MTSEAYKGKDTMKILAERERARLAYCGIYNDVETEDIIDQKIRIMGKRRAKQQFLDKYKNNALNELMGTMECAMSTRRYGINDVYTVLSKMRRTQSDSFKHLNRQTELQIEMLENQIKMKDYIWDIRRWVIGALSGSIIFIVVMSGAYLATKVF